MAKSNNEKKLKRCSNDNPNEFKAYVIRPIARRRRS